MLLFRKSRGLIIRKRGGRRERERERELVGENSKLERRERRKREQKNNTIIEKKTRNKDDKHKLCSYLELSTASLSLLLLRSSSSLE